MKTKKDKEEKESSWTFLWVFVPIIMFVGSIFLFYLIGTGINYILDLLKEPIDIILQVLKVIFIVIVIGSLLGLFIWICHKIYKMFVEKDGNKIVAILISFFLTIIIFIIVAGILFVMFKTCACISDGYEPSIKMRPDKF